MDGLVDGDGEAAVAAAQHDGDHDELREGAEAAAEAVGGEGDADGHADAGVAALVRGELAAVCNENGNKLLHGPGNSIDSRMVPRA